MGSSSVNISDALEGAQLLYVDTAPFTYFVGCEAFLTNDQGIKPVTDIRVLILDELELDPPSAEST
jgi:hypothetical protein